MKEVIAARKAPPAAVERRAKLFRGLADPSRLAILDALCATALAVGEIAERTGLTQPNVSNHLRCLSDCGLVTGDRSGRFTHYRLSDARVAAFLHDADALLGAVAVGVEACSNYRHAEGKTSR